MILTRFNNVMFLSDIVRAVKSLWNTLISIGEAIFDGFNAIIDFISFMLTSIVQFVTILIQFIQFSGVLMGRIPGFMLPFMMIFMVGVVLSVIKAVI